MTRKEVHEYSIAARKRVEDVWTNHGLRSNRAKLIAKCHQVVSGDRVKCYAFHQWMKSGVESDVVIAGSESSSISEIRGVSRLNSRSTF